MNEARGKHASLGRRVRKTSPKGRGWQGETTLPDLRKGVRN